MAFSLMGSRKTLGLSGISALKCSVSRTAVVRACIGREIECSMTAMLSIPVKYYGI